MKKKFRKKTKKKSLKKTKKKSLKKKKIKKFKKRRKNKPKKRIRIRQKIQRRKTAKKQKIKIPKFKKQRKHLIKLSFQKAINFVLQPIFTAYDDFRQKRKIEKLRKIALEKKERESKCNWLSYNNSNNYYSNNYSFKFITSSIWFNIIRRQCF